MAGYRHDADYFDRLFLLLPFIQLGARSTMRRLRRLALTAYFRPHTERVVQVRRRPAKVFWPEASSMIATFGPGCVASASVNARPRSTGNPTVEK